MMKNNAIDDRINKCKKILEEDPNSQVFASLADSFRKKGELDKAFRVCHNGLKIHPSYASAHVVMAKINLDRRMYDWAEMEAKKAVELEGWNRTNELLVSEIYIYKGEFKKAIELLKKLNFNEPDNVQIKKLLDIAKRIPEEQAQVLQSVADKTPVIKEPEYFEEFHEDTIIESKSTSDNKISDKELVKLAISQPDFEGAVLVNHEGLIIEEEWNLEMESKECSATLSEAANLMNQDLMQSSFGEFQAAHIEADSYFYFINRVDVGQAIFITSDKANLGSTRMKIEHMLGRYQ